MRPFEELPEPDEELDAIAHAVIGAALEVHRALGPGFSESVYEEALAVELGLRRLSFERQVGVPLVYKGCSVGQVRLDFLVAERLVVELKAVETLLPLHHSQVVAYLKATRAPLGLLLNFNVRVLREGIRRVVRTRLGTCERQVDK